MPQQLWSAPWAPVGAADGPAVTAAALTDASPIPQKQVPFSTWQVGTQIWLHAQGDVTSTSATPTAQLGFYLGTPGSIATAAAVAVSPALALTATTTAFEWMLDWFGEVRSLGSAGQLYGCGYVTWGGGAASVAADMPQFPVPATAAARLVTVSTLLAAYLMVGCTLSSVTGTPSVTCRHAFGEQRA